MINRYADLLIGWLREWSSIWFARYDYMLDMWFKRFDLSD